MSRVLMRVWPTGRRAVGLDRVGGAANHLRSALATARDGIRPRLGRAVRWGTLPLLAGGTVLIVIAVAVLLLSLAVG